jgi:adenosine deaminase
MFTANPNPHATPPGNAPDWRACPKVLLHEHLDGGLRPQTLLELCQARAVPLPADDAASVTRWIQGNARSGSLERYVQAFGPIVAAMASVQACERVAFEAAEDARLDGCVLAEFRMAPTLVEPHGMRAEEAIEALLAGLKRSSLPSGLIVCAMRTDPPELVQRSARLAAQYQGQGVVGFDLAGAEKGHPATLHAQAIGLARDAGLGLTLHAGEADVGERVLEAAHLGATRIGHGVHVALGPNSARLMEQLLPFNLHFEVCPTSNIHTGVVRSIAEHPIRAMWDAGLNLSCNTDNRLISGVTLSGELQALHTQAGFSEADLRQMMANAARASFLPSDDKNTALAGVLSA